MNRVTRQVVEALEAFGCDPIIGMAKIAMNEKNPIELRGRMFAELAQYIHPKRKAIELSGGGSDSEPIVVVYEDKI